MGLLLIIVLRETLMAWLRSNAPSVFKPLQCIHNQRISFVWNLWTRSTSRRRHMITNQGQLWVTGRVWSNFIVWSPPPETSSSSYTHVIVECIHVGGTLKYTPTWKSFTWRACCLNLQAIVTAVVFRSTKMFPLITDPPCNICNTCRL